jgi:hypothetical protein
MVLAHITGLNMTFNFCALAILVNFFLKAISCFTRGRAFSIVGMDFGATLIDIGRLEVVAHRNDSWLGELDLRVTVETFSISFRDDDFSALFRVFSRIRGATNSAKQLCHS